ncbi:MAG: hypothetical protein CR982_02505 [Candidatus Cloacimonadota bacterium]|nr:MAG: hypothetical protein CR982_02505 [Candidatus Cloacimonadota bacterium]PIE78526.1 MAG: hypothetical protein CSA15_07475 [Candidatus Delongbacteria bacterium]
MKRVIYKIKSGVNLLLNYIFPNRCVLCLEEIEEGSFVCRSCLLKLKPFKNFSKDFYSLYHFDKNIKRLLWLLKYDFRGEIGFKLGKMLGRSLVSFLGRDDIALIPVPLHKHKFYMRGYNQSKLISEGINSVSGWKLIDDMVKRSKFTKSQTTLSKTKRKENMKGAFSLNYPPNPNFIYYIVDDVVTTGATTSQIKDLLISNGAKKVFAVSVAAPNPPERGSDW